jgi:hypothetical protein
MRFARRTPGGRRAEALRSRRYVDPCGPTTVRSDSWWTA